jgi:hypothetical protein
MHLLSRILGDDFLASVSQDKTTQYFSCLGFTAINSPLDSAGLKAHDPSNETGLVGLFPTLLKTGQMKRVFHLGSVLSGLIM